MISQSRAGGETGGEGRKGKKKKRRRKKKREMIDLPRPTTPRYFNTIAKREGGKKKGVNGAPPVQGDCVRQGPWRGKKKESQYELNARLSLQLSTCYFHNFNYRTRLWIKEKKRAQKDAGNQF